MSGGKLLKYRKRQLPMTSRVKRQLRRRMKVVEEIEAELRQLEAKLAAPSPEEYRQMARAGRPLTFEAHILAVVHLISFYLSEACLIAEDYAAMTPSEFAESTNRLWRADLLRSLGNVVELRSRPPVPLPDEES